MLMPRLRAQSIQSARKPNLLVFLPDQFRADVLACYGSRHAFAPNLDKLASQSSIFSRAYITQPVCTPSRSSLLSGTWPHWNGCIGNSSVLNPRLLCLPELLVDNDYHTGYLGKWHLGDEFRAQHGFNEWLSIIDSKGTKVTDTSEAHEISDYAKFLLAHGIKPKASEHGIFSKGFISRQPVEFSRVKFLETKACEFLDRHAREPFILFVAFYEPHPPYNGPLNNEHPLDQIELEPTFREFFGPDIPERYRQRQLVQAKTIAPDTNSYRKIKQRYLGLVTEVDRSIGGVLTKLDQLGLDQNTIVVHTADHGDMMGAHGLFGKCVLFEESARVPYLVRMPGQNRACTITQPVSHIDFVPTLLDLLGKTHHDQCAGASRAALLQGESKSAETIFLQWNGKDNVFKKSHMMPANDAVLHEATRAAITPDGWKLCLRDIDKNELYNLTNDPREQHNLYNDAKYKDVIARLTDEIHRWQERHSDTLKV